MATEAYKGGVLARISKKDLEAQRACLKADFDHLKPIYKRLVSLCAPFMGRFDDEQQTKKTKKLSGTALSKWGELALRTCKAGLTAGMANASTDWMRIQTSDANLNESTAVKRWLSPVTDIQLDTFAGSNVYNSFAMLNGEGMLVGMKAMFIDEDDEHTLWTHPLTIGEYYVSCGPRGDVDTIFISLKYTVKNMMDMFGEACSQNVKNLYKQGALYKYIETIHCCYPNPEYNESKKLELEGKKYLSVRYEVEGDEGKLLSVKGYWEKPFVCSRTEKVGGETYGYCPGMTALGAMEKLNVWEKEKGKALKKKVSPALMAPESMRNSRIGTLDNDINYYPEGSQDVGVKPLYAVLFDIRELSEDMLAVIREIESAFYVPQFQAIIATAGEQRTAEEVREIKSEKIMQLGPLVFNDKAEFYDGFVDRSFGIHMRAGKFPEPPPELEGVALKVELISMLAQDQKALKVGKMDDLVNKIAALVQIFPTIGDKFDADQYIDESAEGLGVPGSIVRSDDEVAELRQARKEAEQAATEMVQAREMAATAKDAAAAGSMMPPGGAQAMMDMAAAG